MAMVWPITLHKRSHSDIRSTDADGRRDCHRGSVLGDSACSGKTVRCVSVPYLPPQKSFFLITAIHNPWARSRRTAECRRNRDKRFVRGDASRLQTAEWKPRPARAVVRNRTGRGPSRNPTAPRSFDFDRRRVTPARFRWMTTPGGDTSDGVMDARSVTSQTRTRDEKQLATAWRSRATHTQGDDKNKNETSETEMCVRQK